MAKKKIEPPQAVMTMGPSGILVFRLDTPEGRRSFSRANHADRAFEALKALWGHPGQPGVHASAVIAAHHLEEMMCE